MPNVNRKLSIKIVYSVLVLFLGIFLGVFSKWLDNMAIDGTIWKQYLLETLDLGNVFSELPIWFLIALAISVYSASSIRAGLNVFLFFMGMCTSYHWYSIVFSGFNPQRYMMIWYGLTLFSPILAYICWYRKGKTIHSLIIDILILTIMLKYCFHIGIWYFSFHSVIDTLIFIVSIIILYYRPKYTLISLLGAIVMAVGVNFFIVYLLNKNIDCYFVRDLFLCDCRLNGNGKMKWPSITFNC